MATPANNKLFFSNPNKFFMIRKDEIMTEFFKESDRNHNGKIFATDLVDILEINKFKVDDDELIKIGRLANEGGEITKNDYFLYLKNSSYLAS